MTELAQIFPELPASVRTLDDPHGVGHFFHFAAEKPAAFHVFPLGPVADVVRWTCQHRYEPFWMTAKCGDKLTDVPPETQFWMGETAAGKCVLLVPLVDGVLRASLRGSVENGLELVAETGDAATVGKELTGAFVAVGDEPFELVKKSAKSVASHFGIPLRHEKKTPKFADKFGWCTWDAFYQDVTHENVRTGLQSFADGGVTPKYLILDDGWQSIAAPTETGEKRLTAFAANEKFSGDLGRTVKMAKSEFGIDEFLVWHAFNGYWGGVDDAKLPGYGVRSVARRYSDAVTNYAPELIHWFGRACGLVSPEGIYRFFHDYHRYLKASGVDGVKVDNQAALEGVAAGSGGRVALMRAYREALEGSVAVHFDGNLINCMSCANEMLYGARASNLTRTSTDFWPDKPESHGSHVYVNAQVSLWFGEFIQPDWDMFQSAHPAGPFHAAARALSGGPVYVSDKPDAHNFDLLKKLVLPNGDVPRCFSPGRPTRDCLFHDPTREDILLKIVNLNSFDVGLMGIFNARHDPENPVTVSGDFGPDDIPGLGGDVFAVYLHNAAELFTITRGERYPIFLPELGFEVVTFQAVVNGSAPIGMTALFNGCVSGGYDDSNSMYIHASSRGRLLVYSEQLPTHIFDQADAEKLDLPFTYDAEKRRLEIDLPEAEYSEWAEISIEIEFV